jgi:phosphofructokinase-like protein
MTAPSIRRIGVLTSGGDCAGLNAAIRAVVHRAVQGYGWEVYGILDGTRGLMDRPPRFEPLTLKLFTGNILRMGGTILGTVNKGDPFRFPVAGAAADRSAEVIEGFRLLGLDALIGIGGDGSMRILARLAAQGGFPFIGIPKTIDNDVIGTEFAIGFATAVSTATEALDRLQPTAASHHRVMILEVMGRDAGHIALNAGIAGGADVILIPEIPYRIECVAAKLRDLKEKTGRNHALVVCAEAIRPASGGEVVRQTDVAGAPYGGVGHRLGAEIAAATGAETRVTVLGHVQRGGTPSSRDRIIASAFGVRAVDILAGGQRDRMVAWRNRSVIDIPLEEVVVGAQAVELDSALVQTARGLGISLGD